MPIDDRLYFRKLLILISYFFYLGISPIYPPNKLVKKSEIPPRTTKPGIVPPSTLKTEQITPLGWFLGWFHCRGGGPHMSASRLSFALHLSSPTSLSLPATPPPPSLLLFSPRAVGAA